MKRVIISGATGAIGMALIQLLIKNHVEILILTRAHSKRNFNIPIHPLIHVKYCELKDYTILENDTGKKYDVFYHFAWDGTTGSLRDDLYHQYCNIGYTLNSVDLAYRFGCKLWIGAGSQAEYGRVQKKLTAQLSTNPENGYGIAKLCAGQLSRELCRQRGLRHIWVRVASVYGPYDNENSMIMSTVKRLLNNEIQCFTKGEQEWDYLYSSDAAMAFWLLAERGLDGKVYCLGSGRSEPLYNYIEIIKMVVNKEAVVELGTKPYSDKQIMYLCADIEDLVNDTGFSPVVSFQEGIKNIKEFLESK